MNDGTGEDERSPAAGFPAGTGGASRVGDRPDTAGAQAGGDRSGTAVPAMARAAEDGSGPAGAGSTGAPAPVAVPTPVRSPAPGEASATPVIDLDGLQVNLGKQEVLRGISCRLGIAGAGKAVGLLGPNGAGKSTLIRTLLGFHRPAAGSARILGHDCRTESRAVKGRIGYMPETDAFVADQTAVRFLRVMGELSGLPSRVALEKAHEVLFHVGLGEARYRRLGTYSVGMKQMAKLAQAIVHAPELLILDEPTNGLDPAARSRMLKLVREMKQDHGMSVLLCSHLLRDVEEVCDEVVILKDGAIVHHTDLEEERRANRRFVELEVVGDDSGLAEALWESGAEGVTESAGRWRIVLPPEVEIGVVWELVAQEELLVRHLSHRRDSLEEIFLKAVGHLETTMDAAAEPAMREVADGRL